MNEQDVRKIARLARLQVDEAGIDDLRTRLSSVLGYIECLGRVDLAGVEPMSHPGGTVNRLRDDEPGPALAPDVLAGMAPETVGPYVSVPRVIGDGGGA